MRCAAAELSEMDENASLINDFRDSVRTLLADIAPPARLRHLGETPGGFDRQVWGAIAEAGWLGILVPEAQGGLGLGLRELLVVMEQIGYQPLPEPFIGAGVHGVALLLALPAGERRDRLLTDVLSGKTVMGVAWQEAPGELSTAVLRTRVSDGRLTGTKRWVVPGEGADGWLALVTGLAGVPALYWVPASPATGCENVARIDGTSMATLRLDGAPGELLAEGATVLPVVAHATDIARLAQAAELFGMARKVFDATLEYVRTRVQFGKPIGANQALQHRMVDAYIQIELSSACLSDVLAQIESGAGELAALASRAKVRCGDCAVQLTRLAVQLHGAIGYTDECDIGLYWKRAVHLATWLGVPSAHRSRYLRLQPEKVDEGEEQESVPVPPPGTDWAAMPEAQFRKCVRSFLHAHYPPDKRFPSQRLHWNESKDWYLTLSRQGWLAPAWPRAHGGMALPPGLLLAYIEEFEDFGVARMPDQGLINLGPLLIQYGTPEQQKKWLPKIISGEHIWCQGYSEPGAGSDLASLRTEAVLEGDAFVVNGQKIWTTLAQDATHIFLLVRTDKTVKKQAGISFLLADLKTPGVTVRPIRNIVGEEEFCEVFLDNVQVPRENLVGKMNEGWTIAKALLGFERLFIGSPKTCVYALGQLRQLARARGFLDDPAFAAEYASLTLDVADLQASYTRFADIVKRGDPLPASISLLKIWASETYTRIAAALVEVAAEDGGSRESLPIGPIGLNPTAPIFNATVTTIYGGTNEIQRNILARAVLALPS